MKHTTVTLLLLFFCSIAFAQLPNSTLTPGVANPSVTQDNIQQTICKSGWTKTIRPTSVYTTKLKRFQLIQYKYTDLILGDYEEDHLISLEIGGHPTDPKNLWPQPYNIGCGARIKDQLETKLKGLVCAGKITLKQAQDAVTVDWVASYKQYVHPLGCGK